MTQGRPFRAGKTGEISLTLLRASSRHRYETKAVLLTLDSRFNEAMPQVKAHSIGRSRNSLHRLQFVMLHQLRAEAGSRMSRIDEKHDQVSAVTKLRDGAKLLGIHNKQEAVSSRLAVLQTRFAAKIAIARHAFVREQGGDFSSESPPDELLHSGPIFS